MAKASGKTILFIVDEADVALETAAALGRGGYTALVAESAQTALSEIRDFGKVDLALLDLGLGNGRDADGTAEAISREFDVPIVFLFDPAWPGACEVRNRFPAYGYVARGCPETAMLATICTALRFFDTERVSFRRARKLEAANRKLVYREAEFRSLFDAVPAGVGMLKNRRFLKVNAAMCELFGYSEDELLGRTTRILYLTEEEYRRIGVVLYNDLKGRNRSIVTTKLKKKDGSPVDVLIGASSLIASGDEAGSKEVATVVVDISDLKRMEAELRETRDFLYKSQVIGRSGSFVLSVSSDDVERETWRGSPMMDTILGIGPEYPRTFKAWLDLIVQRETIKAEFAKANQDRRSESDLLYQIIRSDDGQERWIHSQDQLQFDAVGNPVYRVGTIQDITEQMNVQKDLDAALHQQETLFRELQHRVKNSFALISGILSLESGRATDETTCELLDQIRDRVVSLASLYDLLFQSHKMTTVSLDSYIRSVLESLSSSFMERMGRIRLEDRLQVVEVATRNSAAWGLVVNELVTNALKYAFPDERSGTIWIDLRIEGPDVVLLVSDDGVELPDGFVLGDSTGLGLNLVSMMAEQLGGTLEFSGGNVKTFRVRAPKNAPR